MKLGSGKFKTNKKIFFAWCGINVWSSLLLDVGEMDSLASHKGIWARSWGKGASGAMERGCERQALNAGGCEGERS